MHVPQPTMVMSSVSKGSSLAPSSDGTCLKHLPWSAQVGVKKQWPHSESQPRSWTPHSTLMCYPGNALNKPNFGYLYSPFESFPTQNWQLPFKGWGAIFSDLEELIPENMGNSSWWHHTILSRAGKSEKVGFWVQVAMDSWNNNLGEIQSSCRHAYFCSDLIFLLNFFFFSFTVNPSSPICNSLSNHINPLSPNNRFTFSSQVWVAF